MGIKFEGSSDIAASEYRQSVGKDGIEAVHMSSVVATNGFGSALMKTKNSRDVWEVVGRHLEEHKQ